MLRYFPLIQILRIGLALTFLANGLGAFLAPNEFMKLTESSFLYKDLMKAAPFFIYYIGLNDFCLAFLLINKIWPVETAWWAVFWILGVISVFLTQGNTAGYLGVIDHGSALAIALYLALSPSASGKV